MLTVYLAKEEIIPEFRPLFDTFDKEKEAIAHRDHIQKTEKYIDDIQAKLKIESLQQDYTARLTTILNTSLSELKQERTRLQTLEREIKQSQVISRTLGFLFYIVLGGVFGSLLASRVKVEGLSGDLPAYFQSIVIGATWTSYLSTIGFRSSQKQTDATIKASLEEAARKLDTAKKETIEVVHNEVAEAEKSQKVDQPVRAEKVAKIVAEKFDQCELEIQKDLDLTRQRVQKYGKGIL